MFLFRNKMFLFYILCVFFYLFEILFKINGSSLCSTSGCEVASKSVVISEYFLLTLAGLFFLSLAFFSFSKRATVSIKNINILLLFLAMAADGVLLGYQFSVIREECLICLLTCFFFVFALVCESVKIKAKKHIILGILIWISSFLPLFILDFTPKTVAIKAEVRVPTLEDTAVGHVVSVNSYPKYYLFYSYGCEHCKEILNFMDFWKDAEIFKLYEWNFCPVYKTGQENILVSNDMAKVWENFTVCNAKECSTKINNAKNYMKNINQSEIPVLIIVKPDSTEILSGDKTIMKKLAG